MKLLTNKQASERIGVHPRTLIEWVLKGKAHPYLRGSRGRGKTHLWSERQVTFLRGYWRERQ